MLSNKPIYIQPESKRIAARSREFCGLNDGLKVQKSRTVEG